LLLSINETDALRVPITSRGHGRKFLILRGFYRVLYTDFG
jgi:hypothetical protein